MPTVNTYARSACVTSQSQKSQSADGRRRALSGCRLGHVLLLFMFLWPEIQKGRAARCL
jgi:hypothetical protein